ncbi:hypothetical protein TNCV_4696061 [Trichonephila clavipes]|nr:hypothetical protein TNCV_4696061 [Trichonephila clavipes]
MYGGVVARYICQDSKFSIWRSVEVRRVWRQPRYRLHHSKLRGPSSKSFTLLQRVVLIENQSNEGLEETHFSGRHVFNGIMTRTLGLETRS